MEKKWRNQVVTSYYGTKEDLNFVVETLKKLLK